MPRSPLGHRLCNQVRLFGKIFNWRTRDHIKPRASLLLTNVVTGNHPKRVAWDATRTFDPANRRTAPTIDIDWGDGGGHSTALSGSHDYSTRGSKTVTMTVTDASGDVSTLVQTVTAFGAPVINSISKSPSSGASPLTVTFGASITATDGAIATYDWDFGDSSGHSALAAPVHTYTGAATRTVTLTVTDVNSNVHTLTSTIVIS